MWPVVIPVTHIIYPYPLYVNRQFTCKRKPPPVVEAASVLQSLVERLCHRHLQPLSRAFYVFITSLQYHNVINPILIINFMPFRTTGEYEKYATPKVVIQPRLFNHTPTSRAGLFSIKYLFYHPASLSFLLMTQSNKPGINHLGGLVDVHRFHKGHL